MDQRVILKTTNQAEVLGWQNQLCAAMHNLIPTNFVFGNMSLTQVVITDVQFDQSYNSYGICEFCVDFKYDTLVYATFATNVSLTGTFTGVPTASAPIAKDIDKDKSNFDLIPDF